MKLFIAFLFVTHFCFGQNISSQYDFPKIKSNITVPIVIPLNEVSKMVNTSVKDLIFEDNSYTDNYNDQFKIKVWKTKPIRLIGGNQQNLIIEVPLKIWAQKGIGTLGVYSYQETTFETVMYFNTKINFNQNWKITTSTQPNGFKWVTKPVLDYGNIKIPITSLVEKSLKKEHQKFCSVIDQQMAMQLNLQPYIVTTWNAFAQPIQVSEEYNTWLKITPLKVSATPLKFYSNQIETLVGVETFSETYTGYQPSANPLISTVGNWIPATSLPNQFNLQTTANIPFSEATIIAQKMFLNKEFDFDYGKSKIKITDIQVYEESNRVMIETKTEGGVKGTSFISGIPVYDAEKKKIVLTDTQFKLKTSNILQKAGTALFKGKIVNMIENEYGIPTNELEESSRKSTEEAFNKDYHKGISLTGKVQNLQPSNVVVSKVGITAIIDIKAQLNLKIKEF